MSKTFELIIPISWTNAVYEDFEYLIRWEGRDGSDYLYMFYDAEIQNRIRGEVINSKDGERVESMVDSEKRQITLLASDLSKNDMLIIGQMFSNRYVTRIHKDETVERYAPDSTSFKYRLMVGRYQVEFTLMMSDETVWK